MNKFKQEKKKPIKACCYGVSKCSTFCEIGKMSYENDLFIISSLYSIVGRMVLWGLLDRPVMQKFWCRNQRMLVLQWFLCCFGTKMHY